MMSRRRNRGRVIPVSNDRLIGSPRAIANAMRMDGASRRVARPGVATPRTVHLYVRDSVGAPGHLATCAVVRIAPGVWRAEGWVRVGEWSAENLIPVGDRYRGSRS
jgi:hypothetical protein